MTATDRPTVDPRSPLGRRQPPSRRLPRGRSLLVLVGVVALLGGVVWALWFSSLLQVSAVEVTGVSVLGLDEVLDVAAVPIGDQMVQLDPGAIADRVETLAPVASVTVSRSWPGTVRVAVVERVAALAVPASDGFAVYDASGIRFRTLVAPPDGLPLLQARDPEPAVLAAVLAVADDLPDALRDRLVGIRATTPDSIELDLDDGIVVVWGSAEDNARKAEVLETLMEQPGQVYVVSSPEVPAIRP